MQPVGSKLVDSWLQALAAEGQDGTRAPTTASQHPGGGWLWMSRGGLRGNGLANAAGQAAARASGQPAIARYLVDTVAASQPASQVGIRVGSQVDNACGQLARWYLWWPWAARDWQTRIPGGPCPPPRRLSAQLPLHKSSGAAVLESPPAPLSLRSRSTTCAGLPNNELFSRTSLCSVHLAGRACVLCVCLWPACLPSCCEPLLLPWPSANKVPPWKTCARFDFPADDPVSRPPPPHASRLRASRKARLPNLSLGSSTFFFRAKLSSRNLLCRQHGCPDNPTGLYCYARSHWTKPCILIFATQPRFYSPALDSAVDVARRRFVSDLTGGALCRTAAVIFRGPCAVI